jgi:hypothetical protein
MIRTRRLVGEWRREGGRQGLPAFCFLPETEGRNGEWARWSARENGWEMRMNKFETWLHFVVVVQHQDAFQPAWKLSYSAVYRC